MFSLKFVELKISKVYKKYDEVMIRKFKLFFFLPNGNYLQEKYHNSCKLLYILSVITRAKGHHIKGRF